MSDISTVRHDEIFSARDNNQRVTIIGAGAIGSRVFSALVELGLTKITVIDFDTVAPHNLANQIFGAADVGKLKVEACRDWYQTKTGFKAPNIMEFIDAKIPSKNVDVKGTVFLLTDSMESRQDIFENVLRGNSEVYRVIEVRMASTHGNVHTFIPSIDEEADAWLATLIDDDLAEASACGSSLTVGTTASILANTAVWQFMHAKTDAAAVDTAIDIFLKPMCISTRSLRSDKTPEQIQSIVSSDDEKLNSVSNAESSYSADSILL
jgi:molybdopterin/thiamine biosynthesis adenylyltransferase